MVAAYPIHLVKLYKTFCPFIPFVQLCSVFRRLNLHQSVPSSPPVNPVGQIDLQPVLSHFRLENWYNVQVGSYIVQFYFCIFVIRVIYPLLASIFLKLFEKKRFFKLETKMFIQGSPSLTPAVVKV